MPVDSNRPYQRVHNGGDGIWDGAAWGAVAGAGATAAAYGAAVPLSGHMQNRIAQNGADKLEAMRTRNEERMMAGKRHHGPIGIEEKIAKRSAGMDKSFNRWGKVGRAGEFGFGSKTRIAASAATGLLGGMLAGAGIDHLN